jgi:hypothetical protein
VARIEILKWPMKTQKLNQIRPPHTRNDEARMTNDYDGGCGRMGYLGGHLFAGVAAGRRPARREV